MMRHSWVVLMVLAVLLTGTGCKEGSFVERRFDNFKAHYNKYYNAKRAFQQGVDAREQLDQPVDQEQYISIFADEGSGRISGDFQATIDKGAEILRKHPRSKWVDDALMLIGKSYFYQGGYVGAEQKFREVIDIGSPLADEAEFWLARTLVASKGYEDAQEVLETSLDVEEGGRRSRWQASLHLVQGELHVQRREWEAAAEALELGLGGVRDRDLAARAQFLLGQVYETLERYSEAADAYAEVRRYKPLYELSYAAQVSEVRMRGLHGEAETALNLIRRMKRDDKNFSYTNNLDLLQGQVLTAAGRYDDAFDIYDELLYDVESNVGALRGRVHYAMAELYRDGYVDYFLTAAHFDTASSSLRNNRSTQELYTPYAIVDAQELADVFGQFREVAERIIHNDSLLALGQLDEAAFDSAIAAIRLQQAEEARRRRAEMDRRMAENRFRGAAAGNTGGRGARNMSACAGVQGTNLGFLKVNNPICVEEGFELFKEVWGERPHVPHWRRQASITVTLALREEQGLLGEEASAFEGGMFIPPVDVSSVPRDPESQAKMRADQAAAQYELANVLFLSMNRPDSAASWYRSVIETDSTEGVAQRAYLALAEVQLALKDTLSGHRLYRQIIDEHPESEFASRARERLGIPATEEIPDSLTLAREQYELAYDQWQQGLSQEAFEEMLKTALAYPTTEIAPRALLAAGLIYTQYVQDNDGNLFGRIPVREGLLPPPPDSIQALIDARQARLDSIAQVSEVPAPTDTLVLGDDLVLGDSLTVEDSLVVGDPLTTVALPVTDSLVTDSLMTDGPVTDSLAVSDAGPGVAAEPVSADSTHPDYYVEGFIPQPLWLETLYASVEEHFPSTPYAERAQRLRRYLDEQRPQPEESLPDSLAMPSDSLGNMVTDSLGIAPPDSLQPALPGSIPVPVADSLQQTPHDPLQRAVPDSMPVDPTIEELRRRRDILLKRQADTTATASGRPVNRR